MYISFYLTRDPDHPIYSILSEKQPMDSPDGGQHEIQSDHCRAILSPLRHPRSGRRLLPAIGVSADELLIAIAWLPKAVRNFFGVETLKVDAYIRFATKLVYI